MRQTAILPSRLHVASAACGSRKQMPFTWARAGCLAKLYIVDLYSCSCKTKSHPAAKRRG